MLRALWRPFPIGSKDAVDDDSALSTDERLRRALSAHYSDVWRMLRRLGVPEPSVEDAAQQVFLVAASKLPQIDTGKERAFLIATAVRVAANTRRLAHVRYEQSSESAEHSRTDLVPGADELLDEKRMRALLDAVLDSLPDSLRVVFVLFELEELGLDQIAATLAIPRGTAASRLRRAREAFETAARRERARAAFRET